MSDRFPWGVNVNVHDKCTRLETGRRIAILTCEKLGMIVRGRGRTCCFCFERVRTVESSFVVKAVLNFSISRLKSFSVDGSIGDSLSYRSVRRAKNMRGGGGGHQRVLRFLPR